MFSVQSFRFAETWNIWVSTDK